MNDFAWSINQLESGKTVRSGDLHLKLVNNILFASIDEEEPWTAACITWEIIKRNNWEVA